PDWSEYNLSITNSTSQAVEGFLIRIPVSGTASGFQSWGKCSADYQDGYITIYHAESISAGSTYTYSSDDKFGFGGGAVLGTPEVLVDDGKYTSSNKTNYALTGEKKNVAFEDTPFGQHGKLQLKEVEGYSAPIIVDQYGKPYQLRGASTHGIHWNEMTPYVNKDAFQSLRDEWGVNMVRLVSYVTQSGYTQGAGSLLDTKIQEGVQYAKELGMYVIVDWHIHAENPHTTKAQAEEFFRKYAAMYQGYDNVIFEICNEPTGVVWYDGSGGDLYSYCKDIAGIIRYAGSDALIVCGTNTWSQDVEDVAKKPLKDDGFKNILYTFHFYSGSHYNDKMDKVRMATAAGTPIFVTEFGICDASGNGGYDTANADKWIELLDERNISYACWSLCNKNESASYLLPSCSKYSGWLESDLSKTGIWLVNTYRAHQDQDNGEDTSKGENPESSSIPGASAKPGSSTNPGGNTSPGSSSNPGGSTNPGSSSNPGGSTNPGSSSNPGGSTNPGGNTNPGSSTNPGASMNPGSGTTSGDNHNPNGSGMDGNGQDTQVDQIVLSQKTDKDIKGSVYAKLALKAAKTTKNSVTLKWNRVSGANRYVIYGNRCGNANQLQKLQTVTGTSWTHKNLTKGTYYKYVVAACRGDVAVSIAKTVHATTAGGKKGNAKNVKLAKTKVKLKKGKKMKIKAAMVAAPKKTKIAIHRRVSYETSNNRIASVSSGGVIKARKKGSCVIYVYAQNGVSRKVKVTVTVK
ncbi:MAG: cellulase family glycosylhydrolase, partial [Lachnospiraceae bacterium]|nr:cellulase family glycosylhydrolase [Lachnospiraceae bacterium]